MHRFSIFLFLLLISLSSFAQKKGKPKLIVYGQGEAAMASAVQASNSGVNTIWINPEASFKSVLTDGAEIKRIDSYDNIDAGLWAEFLKQSLNAKDYSDSVFNRSKVHLNPRISMNAFEKMIDSSKNLTVIHKTDIRRIKRSGKKRWQIDLSNGDSYKVFAVVDASLESNLVPLIDKEDKISHPTSDFIPSVPVTQLYSSNIYRTSLFIIDNQEEAIVPATTMIRPYADNIFVVYGADGILKESKQTVEDVPAKMLYGQSLGAIAGYCAFFEIKYDKINIRTLQGELFAFKGRFLPFHDVPFNDVHFGSIQRIGLTGIIQGRPDTAHNDRMIFDLESHVSSMELETIMKSFYTRSQIWFADKKIEELKLKDLLSLIKFVALKGNELDATVQKGWKPKFHFSGEYDPECIITRKQAAVLIDTYLQPFNVKINAKGDFMY